MELLLPLRGSVIFLLSSYIQTMIYIDTLISLSMVRNQFLIVSSVRSVLLYITLADAFGNDSVFLLPMGRGDNNPHAPNENLLEGLVDRK